MKHSEKVLTSIPQKPPFLFVDNIISQDENKIITCYQITGDEFFFAGHFPGNPVMPAVIMQEALFQSAALLLADLPGDGLGVVTRVSDGKFKKMLRPGDEMVMEVLKEEQLENAFYMKGVIKAAGKNIVGLKFVVTRIES